jgi:tetratricopeptide (TPR) repeat protein
MLVTLPFVLLLLDYWPLQRFSFHKESAGRLSRALGLILEKVPLFFLCGLSVYVSSVTVQKMGIVKSLQAVPMVLRIENALVSYVKYMAKMVWPFDLAVLYPYPEKVPEGELLLALFILLAVSVIVIWALRAYAYMTVGWFWYVGTLVPVIGLVQAGLWPAMADRWAYLPLIGLFIAIVWGIAEFADVWPAIKRWIPVAATLVLGALSTITWQQVGYWKSSVELFRHTLEVTADNAVAHSNLGNALLSSGKTLEAYQHYAEAIRIQPDFAEAHYNIARILTDQGKLDAALKHYASAIRANPRFKKAYYNQAIILAQKGSNSAAIRNFTNALRIDPDYAEAHNNLGVLLVQQGDVDEAISHFTAAVRLRRNYKTAQKNLQKALSDASRIDSVHYQKEFEEVPW